jgi:glycosyltransferase involved in cell wall biosynthesis
MAAPTLSLCMIVKNEERFLPSFIERHRDFFDEWIIVDTGSTDRTREIIADAGLPTYTFEWCNDFAAARNDALRRCTGDWIAAFDADETLDETGQSSLKRCLETHPADGALVIIKNYIDERVGVPAADYTPPDGTYTSVFGGEIDYGYNSTELVRFFRNHQGYRWRSPIHEVLECKSVAPLAERVCLHHQGTLDAEGKTPAKERMYRELSQQLHGELEGSTDPKVLFEAARHLPDPEKKIRVLQKGLQLVPNEENFLKELANTYLSIGRVKDALLCCKRLVETYPDSIEGILGLANCHAMMGMPEEGFTFLKKRQGAFRSYPMFHFTAAKLAAQAERFAEARSYATRAHRLAPSSHVIKDLWEQLSEKPIEKLNNG